MPASVAFSPRCAPAGRNVPPNLPLVIVIGEVNRARTRRMWPSGHLSRMRILKLRTAPDDTVRLTGCRCEVLPR